MNYARIFGLLSVVLVIAAMIPLAGCGKGEPEPTPTPFPTATGPLEPTGETGTLSGIHGVVRVQRLGAGAWLDATSGMKIGAGDNLKTGHDGSVLITFFDGSVMEVEPDTEISVEELSEAASGSTTVHINQAMGNTLNRVESLIDSASTYEVETPAGTAAVRGTIFDVGVERLYGILHTCVNTSKEDDEANHFIGFSNLGTTVNVTEGKTSCCWQNGVPGRPFYTDSDDDPASFTGGGGGGGGGGCYGYGCPGYPTPTPSLTLECSPGCYYYQVGDGYCQEYCYTQACNWDSGDCMD